MRRLIVGAGVLIALAACSPDVDQDLDETLWTLESVEGATIIEDPPASIGFGAGEVGGTTGCNTFGGPYRVVPGSDSLSMGPFRSSLAICPSDELAARERAMLASLEATAAYEITSDGLEMKDASGEKIATYAELVPELEGTSWVVIGLNTGNQSVRSIVVGTELTMEFSEDGVLSGSTGCNTYSGGFETGVDYGVVAGQELRIESLAVTERACLEPEGVMEQESLFLNALGNTTAWRFVGQNLELRDAEGALQVSLLPGS